MRRSSFYYEFLRTWIKTIVNKFAISNYTALILGMYALRTYLKLICEYELHCFIAYKIKSSVAQKIMVKTTSRSDRPWSAIFGVIVYCEETISSCKNWFCRESLCTCYLKILANQRFGTFCDRLQLFRYLVVDHLRSHLIKLPCTLIQHWSTTNSGPLGIYGRYGTGNPSKGRAKNSGPI